LRRHKKVELPEKERISQRADGGSVAEIDVEFS
jgi:hypothetical protein